MHADAVIRVRFLTTNEGGRKSNVVGTVYSCPMLIDNEAFDCRVYLEGKTLELGSTYDVPVRFLAPDVAVPRLGLHKRVHLWEGFPVADAEIVSLPWQGDAKGK